MAAGGYKEFVAGETLDQDEINDYLMQGMLVFAGTAARGSAIGTPVEGQFSFLKDSDSVEFFDGSQWTGLETTTVATGGDHVGTANGYKYHVFLSSGNFVLSSAEAAVEYLILGGGGAGGSSTNASHSTGGGGAGGLLKGIANLTAGTYTITIGDGGAASSGNVVSGNDSSFASVGTAKAGGGGGLNPTSVDAVSGASGGGGAASSTTSASGAVSLGVITATESIDFDGIGEQGHSGGRGATNDISGGGGGGAGSPGHDGAVSWGVNTGTDFGLRRQGGIGVRLDDWGADASTVAGTAIGDSYTYTPIAGGTAVAYFFASGGSGGVDAAGITNRAPGGGGAGGDRNTAPTSGLDGTGGGGGGHTDADGGGNGGSGLVIVRYAV